MSYILNFGFRTAKFPWIRRNRVSSLRFKWEDSLDEDKKSGCAELDRKGIFSVRIKKIRKSS